VDCPVANLNDQIRVHHGALDAINAASGAHLQRRRGHVALREQNQTALRVAAGGENADVLMQKTIGLETSGFLLRKRLLRLCGSRREQSIGGWIAGLFQEKKLLAKFSFWVRNVGVSQGVGSSGSVCPSGDDQHKHDANSDHDGNERGEREAPQPKTVSIEIGSGV
jgi:hypothetical protein